MKFSEEKAEMRKHVYRRDESFERLHIFFFWRLDKLGCNNLKVFEFLNFTAKDIIQNFILEENIQQLLPLADKFLIGQGLKKVCSKHPRTSVGETLKVLNEAVLFSFSLCVEKDLQFGNSL